MFSLSSFIFWWKRTCVTSNLTSIKLRLYNQVKKNSPYFWVVTPTKKTGILPVGHAKDKANDWKRKAVARRKETGKLRKRPKEVKESREGWKKKYKGSKKGVGRPSLPEGEKAAEHWYSLPLIVLVAELYKYGGMSLRGCRHGLSCVFISLGLDTSVPSHGSIRNWLCKCGMYRVKMSPPVPGEHVVFRR